MEPSFVRNLRKMWRFWRIVYFRNRERRGRFISRGLHSLFHWKYSSIIIPCLWPLGVAMVGLAVVDFVPDGIFLLGKLLFLAALIWSVGGWQTSRTLHRLKKRDPRSGQKAYQFAKWVISALIVLLFLSCLRITNTIQLNKSLASYEGVLYPSNKPDPLDCHLSKDALAVFVGDGYAVTASRLPLTVFRITGNDPRPILIMNRRPDGSLSINLDIRSDDQKVVVSIVDNAYTVNHNNILKMSRKNDSRDQSSLSVTDQRGNEVLNLRYLNPHAFQIKARMSMDGHVLDTGSVQLLRNICLNVAHGPEGASAIAF